jgi:hypothetical protein
MIFVVSHGESTENWVDFQENQGFFSAQIFVDSCKKAHKNIFKQIWAWYLGLSDYPSQG